MDRPIYLDFNASTPIAPEVLDVLRPLLETAHGNPSSRHWAGAPARAAVERAREQVANLLGASPDEIVFTSGGSEANNAAIKGAYFAAGRRDAGIVTSVVEHPATLEPCAFLERLGARVTRLPVDGTARVDPGALERALGPETILTTLMHANNEVGTLQPIAEIGRITRSRGVLLHVDAAQSAGKVPTRVDELGCELLSIAGHKLYAPKGIGALYVRRGVKLEPLIHGGGHESGRRAGTESAFLAAALGAAAELAVRGLERSARLVYLRDRLERGLARATRGGITLHGHREHRLPNTLNVGFIGREGAAILAELTGVAASTGSACHAGSVHLSPVLRAMGVDPASGMGAVRFSLGSSTTEEEIDAVISAVARSYG